MFKERPICPDFVKSRSTDTASSRLALTGNVLGLAEVTRTRMADQRRVKNGEHHQREPTGRFAQELPG